MLLIEAIEAFSDNYIWLLHNTEKAWLVDPGESSPVLQALQQKQLQLQGILITHHHFDHVGAVDELSEKFSDLSIVGPASSHPKINQAIEDGDSIKILGHFEAEVGAVPGHTLDHLYYFFAEQKALFCGDTLFSGGCGRVFEGTMPMMYESLQKLLTLPKDSSVYCAHEYTRSNLEFALAADPENQALKNRLNDVDQLRAHNKATVPSTLADELSYNPFLRCSSDDIIENLMRLEKLPKQQNPQGWQVFQALREWKDCY